MSQELSKQYNAKDVENKWYSKWEEAGYFKPSDSNETPYTIVIPPPNVTGILHMGHALNNSIQDILIRWQRMKGSSALWVPGMDHAGIATQNVVEKKLAKDGKRRDDFGREKFIEQVWDWKEEYGGTIVKQLRKLGASCDWSRERFTMDEGLSRSVREVFVRLYEEGLIYQGNYIINWCPRCETALSDEEAEHSEDQGNLWHFKYPVKDSDEFVTIATTRPETMLGDTAVAVNPKDERYTHLHGKTLILPLVGREIPIITDDFVDPEFGTGCVKVTPAHDPNDFQMGKRHDLEEINIFTEQAIVNENGGKYEGQDRFKARKSVLADLEKEGLLGETEDHVHAVGHCYRCDTVVEPYYSKQWFVKMKPLADAALKKRKEYSFYPERWGKVYENWLNNIRDWCISRQIWWGHQIPIWYDEEGTPFAAHSEEEAHEKAKEKHGKEVQLTQDPDVLDTWFSSWLWPFSTLGWPDETDDLKKFYPTSTLVTGPDILFFWVARMIMAGVHFKGEIPFKDIYLHGTVRDETGRKMSKSLGNIIDPLEIVDEIGADALRFVVISLTSTGQDVYLSKQRFEGGRNFTNKIWNAARFAFMNLEGFKEGSDSLDVEFDSLSTIDKWIVIRLDELIKNVEEALEKYRFNDACIALQHFIWGEFCDWYLEFQKPVLYGNRGEEEKKKTQAVLFYVMNQMLKALHPFMPFITEEIWQTLKEYAAAELGETIMQSTWPTRPALGDYDTDLLKKMTIMQEVIGAIREKRTRYQISTKAELNIILKPVKGDFSEGFLSEKDNIISLTKITSLEINSKFKKETGWLRLNVPSAVHDFEAYIFLGDILDTDKEIEKMTKELDRLKNFHASVSKKLENKANPDIKQAAFVIWSQ